MIIALGRQRQADLCEFEGSLVYRASSRTARAMQRNAVFKGERGRKGELQLFTQDVDPLNS